MCAFAEDFPIPAKSTSFGHSGPKLKTLKWAYANLSLPLLPVDYS